MAGEQLVPWWYPGLAIGMIDYVTNKYLLDEEDPMSNEPRHMLYGLPDEVKDAAVAVIHASERVGLGIAQYPERNKAIDKLRQATRDALNKVTPGRPTPSEATSAEVFYAIRPEDKDWHCYSCGEPIIVGDDFVLGPREGVEGLNYFHGGCWEDYDANK